MILSIERVSKAYEKGKKKALDNFSVQLNAGVYGLLGPNGAGKSTLMNIITDNIKADSGEVKYKGINTLSLGRDFRGILGYMPQQQDLYDDFTANRFLWYMSALKGISRKMARERIEYTLDLVGLLDSRYKKLGAFSGGMKQRILIAQALLNDPEILILDEPTAGLDPRERIRIRNFISEIAINKIVILATHVVSDVEFIAREIIFIGGGKLIAKGEPASIISKMEGRVFEAHIGEVELESYRQKYSVSSIAAESGGIKIRYISRPDEPSPEGMAVRANLEEVYLDYFG